MKANASATESESRFFELRIYHAAPGKLDDLNARFRDHTMKLFERHDITNIGYWVPADNTNNLLIYLLAYPSREARETSWKEFMADPDWKAAQKASEVNGKLVDKVDSFFMSATDFSPVIKPSRTGKPLLFELRTYQATPGKLNDLQARFRDHTTTLFKKHGMGQFGYWVTTEKKDADIFIYILAHKDKELAQASWKAFREDPEWAKAKADSEVNGPLTVKGGVDSVFMTPTDYSPTK
jgi:uncharacterized protein YbaA (DUF1428 family)